MNTKGWSLFILAPVAISMSLLTTACGKDEKKKASSPYSGYWMSQAAYESYTVTGRNEKEFCASVYQHPAYHGIRTATSQTEVTKISFRTIRIGDDGAAYWWTPSVRWGTDMATPYRFGTLGEGGQFAAPPARDIRTEYRNRAMYANPYTRALPISGGLQMVRANGRGVERYVRVDESVMIAYSSSVMGCGDFESVEWGYSEGGSYGFDGGFEDFGYEGPAYDPYPQQGPQYQGPRRPQLNQQVPEDTGPVK